MGFVYFSTLLLSVVYFPRAAESVVGRGDGEMRVAASPGIICHESEAANTYRPHSCLKRGTTGITHAFTQPSPAGPAGTANILHFFHSISDPLSLFLANVEFEFSPPPALHCTGLGVTQLPRR